MPWLSFSQPASQSPRPSGRLLTCQGNSDLRLKRDLNDQKQKAAFYRELIVRRIQKYCEIILPLVKGQPFGNGKIPSLRITISYEILISSSQSLFICYVFVLVWSTGVGAEMSNSSFSHPGYFLSKIPCNTSLYNNNNNRAWIHLTSFKNGTLTDSKIISI